MSDIETMVVIIAALVAVAVVVTLIATAPKGRDRYRR